VAISKRLRFEILRRDGFKCRYCHGSEVLLTVDHVVPVTLGGSDHPGNLVASCDDCNAGKTSALPGGQTVDDVNEDLMRWVRALKRAARGDWQAREVEAVVNAATHVWQSYWMPEHQAHPTPELLADFRRKALELYPEEFGADDLMLAAQASAEHGIASLHDALERALQEDLDGDRWEYTLESLTPMAVAVWADIRKSIYPGDATEQRLDKLAELVRKLFERGDEPTDILFAAQAAGACDSEFLATFLRKDPEKAAQIADAVHVWTWSWTRQSMSGEHEHPGPSMSDRESFEFEVGTAIEINVEHDDILRGAALAGGKFEPDISPYIPDLNAHYDEMMSVFEQVAKV
jgi:hypothetical protein